jgi:hypothetical protein
MGYLSVICDNYLRNNRLPLSELIQTGVAVVRCN